MHGMRYALLGFMPIVFYKCLPHSVIFVCTMATATANFTYPYVMTTPAKWTAKDTITALVVVLIWGVNFVPMKYGLETLSSFELGVGRYVFASLPLVFFIKFPKLRPRWVVASALCQGVGQFSLLFMSLEVGMTASLASVLLQTQVFFTAIWSFVIFKQTPSKLLWLSIASAGVGLVFFAFSALQSDGAKSITLGGLLLILSSASMWGAANLVARKAKLESPNYNPLAFIVWTSVVASLVYIVLVMLIDGQSAKWLQLETWQNISAKTWLSLMFLGWVSTLMGYGLWTLLLKRHHANKVAPFSLGVPVVGVLTGLLWLHEPVNALQWIGCFFVGLALLLVVVGPRWLKSIA